MARTVTLAIPHRLDLDEARRRATFGVEQLVTRLPGGGEVAADWPSDDEFILDVLVRGRSIGVHGWIDPAEVRIEVRLPLMLSLLSGPITRQARTTLEALFAAPPPAPHAEPMTPPSARRLPLFQFWDRPEPPADVAAWMADFRRDNPALKHHLFDAERAATLIRKHHGKRSLAAFGACAHPAMQADYFRLCAMVTYGGVYLDADMQSLAPLDTLLARAPEALIATWRGLLNNSILFFREPGHSFPRAALALATQVIEERRFTSVALATGPGIFNAVRYVADPGFRAMIVEMLAHGWEDVSHLIGEAGDPDLNTKIDATLDRATWEDLRILAAMVDRLAPQFPTLAADYARITLIGTADSMAWIGQAPAAYQTGGDHWITGSRQIYR